jgi:hypothetical protein
MGPVPRPRRLMDLLAGVGRGARVQALPGCAPGRSSERADGVVFALSLDEGLFTNL